MTQKKHGEKRGRVGNTTNDAGEIRNRLADRGEPQMDCFRYVIHTTKNLLNSQLCSVPRCWSGKYTHKWKNPNPFVHLCYAKNYGTTWYRRVFVRLGSQIQQISSVRWPCSDGWLVGSWRAVGQNWRWYEGITTTCDWDYPLGIRCPEGVSTICPGCLKNRDVPWSQWLVSNVSN